MEHLDEARAVRRATLYALMWVGIAALAYLLL